MEYADKNYLETHKNIAVRVEMDEMRSFYRDKKHHIWLWRAVGRETGAVTAFWFGRREHKNLDKLLELIEPQNTRKCVCRWKLCVLRAFFTGSSDCCKKEHAKDRTETSVPKGLARPVSEERDPYFKDRADA
jgi:IS1 family transposase